MVKGDKEPNAQELMVKLEKVSAEAVLLRELFSEKDEKLTQTIGELGELKRAVAKAERENKESSKEIKRLNSVLKSLDPGEIEKAIAGKEKMIVEAQSRVKNLELIQEDLQTNYLELSAKIEKLGDFDTITKVYRDVDSGLSAIKEKEENINLVAGRIETRLKEFSKAKRSMDKKKIFSKNKVKESSVIGIKKGELVTQKDLEDVKKLMQKTVRGVSKALGDMRSKADEDTSGLETLRAIVSRQVSGIATQIKTLNGKIELVQSKFLGEIDTINESIEDISFRADKDTADPQKLMEEIEALKNTLNDMHTNLDADTDKRFDTLTEDIEEIKNTLIEIHSKTPEVSTEMLDNLKEEIGEVKKALIGIHSNSPEETEETLDSLKTELTSQVSVFKDNINNMGGRIDSIQGRLVEEVDFIKESLDNLGLHVDKDKLDSNKFKIEIEGLRKALGDIRSENFKEFQGMDNIKLDVSKRVSEIGDIISSLEGRIDSSQNKLVGEIDSIKKSMESMNLKIDEDEVSKRLLGVVDTVNAMEAKINSEHGRLTGEVDVLKKNMDDISVRVGKAADSKEVSGISDVVSSMDGRIDSLQNTLGGEVNAIKESLDSLGQRVDNETVAPLRFDEEIKNLNYAVSEIRFKAVEDTSGMDKVKAELSEQVAGISVVMKTLGEKINSEEGRLNGEIGTVKESLDNLKVGLEKNTIGSQKLEEEIRGVNKALDDMRSKAAEESDGIDSLKVGVFDHFSEVTELIKSLESRINSEHATFVEEIKGLKGSLDGLGKRVDNETVNPKKMKDMQTELEEEFNRFKMSVEGKFSNISLSFNALVEKSLDSIRRFNEISKSFSKLEKDFKRFDTTRPLLLKTEKLAERMRENMVQIELKTGNIVTRDEVEDINRMVKEDMVTIRKELFYLQSPKAAEEIDAIKEVMGNLLYKINESRFDPNRFKDIQRDLERDMFEYKIEMDEKISEMTKQLNYYKNKIKRLEKMI